MRGVGSLKEKKGERDTLIIQPVLEPVSQWVVDIKLRDIFLAFCYLGKGTEVTSLRNPEYLGRIQYNSICLFLLAYCLQTQEMSSQFLKISE